MRLSEEDEKELITKVGDYVAKELSDKYAFILMVIPDGEMPDQGGIISTMSDMAAASAMRYHAEILYQKIQESQ